MQLKTTQKTRVMLGSLLIMLSLCSLQAQDLASIAQNRATFVPDYQEKAKTLQRFLLQLEQENQVQFAYDGELVNNQEVSIKIEKNQKLETILDKVLDSHELQYQKLGEKLYVIKRKNKQEIQKLNQAPDNLSDNEKPALISSIGMIVRVLEQTIEGKVTDQDTQEPLPGVNVLAKGTSTGTVTDINGSYRLTVADEVETLVFSSIGYVTQEVPINGRSNIEITMLPDIQSLSEVVVVGYGQQEKADVTGSIASVSSEDIETRPLPSFEGAIQGRASGVQVRQTGGALDGDFSIAIRGIGSVTGSNEPLYVVDGVPLFSQGFSTINPRDIESIDILKDASATAIYGARAANGVVIITTKSGRSGATNITFNAEFGFENITKTLDQLSTGQQAALFVEAFSNSGRSTDVFDDPNAPFRSVDNDWQDLITRTAKRQNYNFGVSGGNESTTFSISGAYLDREGVMLDTDLRNWSIRTNVDHKFSEKFKVSTRLMGSYQRQNVAPEESYFGGSGTLRQAIFTHSYAPYKDEEGNFIGPENSNAPYFGNNTNPVARRVEEDLKLNTTRILGNVKADYNLTNNLVFSVNLGGDILTDRAYTFLPVFDRGIYQRVEGQVTESINEQINGVADATLQYDITLNEKHDLTALAGVSVQQFIVKQFSTTGQGTTDNSLDQLSNQTSFISSGSEVNSGLSSQFLRVNYGYMDKYLLTATVRRDGSSKFGSGNRYGVFPSASLGWRVSEENFLQNIGVIDDLKFRTSYGLTGNQNIGDFAFLTRAGAAPYVWGDNVALGNAPVNIGNPNLQWESSKQFDIGLDLSLFMGRIYSSMDYYNRISDNLLIRTPIPYTAGITEDPTVNLGSIRNSGFEFAITTRNTTREFLWTTNFNITFNENEVLDIGTNAVGDPLEIPGREIPLGGHLVNLTVVGRPVGAFYMYEFDGVWQLDEEAEAAGFGSVPGDAKYVDNNGNGRVDDGDRTFVGNPTPTFFGGITNTFEYKGFTLTAFLNYSGGNQLFNGARHLFGRSVPFVQNLAEVADFWTPENPSNIPRPSQGGDAAYTTFLSTIASTRFLEDASFLRLQNVSLSYNMPSTITDPLNISNLRLTLTGNNLFTWTNYEGYDPESSSYNSLLSAGQDLTPYPLTKIYTLGVQVNF